MGALVKAGEGMYEPTVNMNVVLLYFVWGRERNRAFPLSGQPDLVRGARRSTEIKEEKKIMDCGVELFYRDKRGSGW